MPGILRLVRAGKGFIAGFVVSALIFGAVASAADVIEKQITVIYPDFTMKFNGVRKAPPEDQRPILIDGRTYVPLRFVAEAMGHPVEFDGAEQTIYVGARPEKQNRPSVLLKPDEDASYTHWQHSTEGISLIALGVSYKPSVTYHLDTKDINGVERHDSWVIEVSVDSGPGHFGEERPASVTLQKDFILNGRYTKLTGTLFPGSAQQQHADGSAIGKLTVKDEYDRVIYERPHGVRHGAQR